MTVHHLSVVFGLCSLINIVLLFVMFVIICGNRELVYQIHRKFFPITESQFNIAIYSFMGLYKILVIVFNIVPWIACNIPAWF
jgi:hypothetical protein